MNADEIQSRLGKEIHYAVRQLLSEKHLYQSATVASEFLNEEAARRHSDAELQAAEPSLGSGGPPRVGPLQEFQTETNKFLDGEWYPSGVRPLVYNGQDVLETQDHTKQKFPAPTIKATCNHCDERGPFNPVGALVEPARETRNDQWISFSYECQNCKGEPIRFLVRRTGTKLTLSGRDPFEAVEIPKVIPKNHHATNFRNALVAEHGGQTLAGVFLMRVFVEQFWKSVPEVMVAIKGKSRPTGDEMGDAYKATLPTDFKDRFPTLAEVYDSLSEAMHSATADAGLFEDCRAKIVEHFEARRLFKLDSPSGSFS